MFAKLIAFTGKLLTYGFLALIIGIAALVIYFFYKSGQPMQVADAQRKGRSCVIVPTLMLPMMYAGSIYEVNYLRLHRGTKEAMAFMKSINNIVPPDELIYGPWWQLPEAWWWQIENMSWWDYYRP